MKAEKKQEEINKLKGFEGMFLRAWRPYVWIIVVGFLLYVRTLTFGFNYLDDNAIILDNFHFISNISNVPRLFTEDAFHHHYGGSLYRPLLALSFMLDAQLGGKSPFIYHFMNILLHIAASSLVFRLLTKLDYSKAASFFFSLIFVVHPMLAQAVAWIPGRNDSLLTIFAVLSFISFLNFQRDENWSSYLWHLLFFTLALFTKETAVLIPIICILYLFLILKERLFSFNKLSFLIGWVGVLIPWFLVRKAALKVAIAYGDVNIIRSLIEHHPAIIAFIGKALFPFNLSVLSVMKDMKVSYGIAAIIIIAILLVFSKRKRTNFVFFGILWFLLFLLPSFMQSTPHVPNFSEHRIYLPLLGLIIVFLEMDFVKTLFMVNRSAYIYSAPLLFIFSGLTLLHIGSYKDGISFWEDAVRTSVHSAFNHNNLGSMYYLKGRIEEAETEWRKALELNPMEKFAHGNLGVIYMNKRLFEKAEEEYRKELRLNPVSENAYFNLGVLYYKIGRMKDAIRLWKNSIKMNPDYTDAYYMLAYYYYQGGDMLQAEYYIDELRAKGLPASLDGLKAVGASP